MIKRILCLAMVVCLSVFFMPVVDNSAAEASFLGGLFDCLSGDDGKDGKDGRDGRDGADFSSPMSRDQNLWRSDPLWEGSCDTPFGRATYKNCEGMPYKGLIIE
jgi:hypothetical protein